MMRSMTRTRAVLAVGALLLCARADAEGPDATRPPAADVAKQAQELLDNGVASFKAGDLARAKVALQRVIALVPDKPNPYRWLGLVEIRLGNCKEALPNFDAFLTRVGMADPRTVEVVTLRDRCRVELEPKVGTLLVATTPPGADVRLRAAGEPLLGKTPLESFSIAVGNHVLALHKDGYADVQRGVSIRDGETVRLDLVLEKLAGKKKKYWIIGAVLGPLAAAGLGVGLGVGLTRGNDTRTLPAIVVR